MTAGPVVFFANYFTHVATDRVVIGVVTYAPGAIVGVSVRHIPRDGSKLFAGGGILALLGLPFFLMRDAPKECLACMGIYMGAGAVVGGLVGLALVLQWAMTPPRFVLVLSVDGVETVAYTSTKELQVREIESGVAQLIASRTA